MKKKLTAVGLGLAAVGLLAFGAPDGRAATCGDGPTRTTDANGNPTDTLGTLPDGGQVYGGSYTPGADPGDPTTSNPADGGYAGVEGGRGYIEASGVPGDPSTSNIEGQSTDAPLSGQINGGGVCVNGTSAP